MKSCYKILCITKMLLGIGDLGSLAVSPVEQEHRLESAYALLMDDQLPYHQIKDVGH